VSLILAWFVFPLVLAAVGLGWGFVVEKVFGIRVHGALLLPLGLATALVIGGTFAAFSFAVPAAVPVIAVGAAAGLPFAWVERRRLGPWAFAAAVGVLLVYGAPVLLSGQATFTGFLRLDDTATWFNIADHLLSHPSAAEQLSSTYSLEYNTALGPTYPHGAFILPAIGRALTGTDIAWVFQPYLAACGAAVALCLYALTEPLIASPRIRALVSFLAAQSALLYGYSLWGGIKELTAAFLLALAVALAAPIFRTRPKRPVELVPTAIATGALVQTLGVGAAGWVVVLFALLAGSWLLLARRDGKPWRGVASAAWLAALIAACMVPVWIVLGDFLSSDESLFTSGQSEAARLGNLVRPLSAFQLAGIWPIGDFRFHPPRLPTVLLVGLLLIAALGAVLFCLRRRQWSLLLYLAVALGGSLLIYLIGATPWVVGKTLAISTPALLAAGLAGGALLWKRSRWGGLVVAVLAFGVLWSNALAYRHVLLAPRPRLAEMQHVGELVDGKGPTLLNTYEIYGDEHFLRQGAPVGPADYRSVNLALNDGALLTASAWADLDSFPLATLEEYRSIVTRRSPAESRPPSNYELVWQGQYYDLWQRPESPSTTILEHIPLGESDEIPYCGAAEGVESAVPNCSANPVATPKCSEIHEIADRAAESGAHLVAYQRPEPIVVRADETVWPGAWLYDPASHTLTANEPGQVVSHINLNVSRPYGLWLGGSFTRGFEVSVDGQHLGTVKDQIQPIGGYAHVADLFLAAGVHTITLTYPEPDLTPGDANNSYTSLNAISLEPLKPPSKLLSVPTDKAGSLCGRPLDWIEIVAGTAS
jgi:hypothetical protein